jgi:microcin C transport system permease protein
MARYILKRLLLIVPTLWAIITVNFFIVQIAPGGPVDQAIANMSGLGQGGPMERVTGHGALESGVQAGDAGGGKAAYRGSRGLDPETVEAIKKRYGFDKPLLVRYLDLLRDYATLNFGDSLFKGKSVLALIGECLPVSASLGLWSTLLIYAISIPLGIRKAVRNGSRFDVWTSSAIVLGNMIPSFLFAIILIVLFAGGSFLSVFPLRGLVSENFASLSLPGKLADYAWHMALPVLVETIGGFATLTMLTKDDGAGEGP